MNEQEEQRNMSTFRNYEYVGDNYTQRGKNVFDAFCKQNNLDKTFSELELNDLNCLCGVFQPNFKKRNFVFNSKDKQLQVVGEWCMVKCNIDKKLRCHVCGKTHENKHYENVCNDCGRCPKHPKHFIGECKCFSFVSWDVKNSHTDGKEYFQKNIKAVTVRVKVCGRENNRVVWYVVTKEGNELEKGEVEYPERKEKEEKEKDKGKYKWFREILFEIEKEVESKYE